MKEVEAILNTYPAHVVRLEDRQTTWAAVLCYRQGADIATACGATIEKAIRKLHEDLRTAAVLRVAEQQKFVEKLTIHEPAPVPKWPDCGCTDGTDPDEPADRGFICPHDPRGDESPSVSATKEGS